MSKKQWGHGFYNGYKKGLNSCGMGEFGELVCPNCGGQFLHHFYVEVFERDSYESKNGLVITVQGGVHISASPDDMARNPSERRDGLRILFSCEFCDVVSALTLEQWKGSSLLNFTKTGLRSDDALASRKGCAS